MVARTELGDRDSVDFALVHADFDGRQFAVGFLAGTGISLVIPRRRQTAPQLDPSMRDCWPPTRGARKKLNSVVRVRGFALFLLCLCLSG